MPTADTITYLNHARALLAALRAEGGRLKTEEGLVSCALLLPSSALARGNPNHVPSGPHGGEFTSGAGGGKGKHSAARKRKRLKARKRKLEQWRKEGHQEIAELKAGHKKDRKELIRDQAREWKQLRRGQVKERNGLRREHKRDKTVRSERRAEHASMRGDHKHERQSLRDDHKTDRASTKQLQHDERREIIDRWVSDIRYEFPKSKTGRPRETVDEHHDQPRSGPSPDRDQSLPVLAPTRDGPSRPGDRRHAAGAGHPGRLSARATHKASSAESILWHCLRRRGWTVGFRDGSLTGRQHLVLLEDIRRYGRAWLRHEAEGLFRHYGVTTHDDRLGRTGPEGRRGDPADARSLPGSGLDTGLGHPGPDSLVGFLGQPVSIDRGLAARIGGAVGRFFDRARSFTRELILAGAMALKGDTELTNQEVIYLDEQARIQAEYLARFEQQVTANPPAELIDPAALQATTTIVQPPPMTAGQFTARAEQYANSTHQAAQRVVRKTIAMNRTGQEERRVLGHPKTEHCTDCPPLAERGWVPLGTLPDIGESECGGLCLCTFEYRNTSPATPPTVNGKAPVRKPRKIVIKKTPNTNPKTQDDRYYREPTHAEIDAEVAKWMAGKPSRLTIKPTAERPSEVPLVVPPGYHYEEAE